MPKKTDRNTLRARQLARNRSKTEMHARIVDEHKNSPTIQKTAIKQQLDYLKNSGVTISEDIVYPDWDEINDLYNSIARGIVEFSEAVAVHYQQVELAGKASEVFLNLVKTALTDSDETSKKLVSIKQLHQGKSGKVSDIEELDLYYSIGGQYNDVYETFRQLAFQISAEITTELSDPNETQKFAELVQDTVVNKTENPL